MRCAHAAVTASSYLSGAPWAVATLRMPVRQRSITPSSVSDEQRCEEGEAQVLAVPEVLDPARVDLRRNSSSFSSGYFILVLYGIVLSSSVSLDADDLIALQRATHALILALEAELESLGLSASETNLIACLTPEGPRRIGELVAATGQRPSTVTGILDRLERRGIVERQLDPDDRRSFRVGLTPDGVSMYRWVREGYENVAARTRDGLEGVARPDLQTMLRAIERVR